MKAVPSYPDSRYPDLRDWKYVGSYGYYSDIYAKGDRRLLIDERTGREQFSYLVRRIER